MSADFTPELGSYTDLKPFRYWCQKVLPAVYDDSLSYYELLCKVVDYLNKTMEDVGTLHGDVENLNSAYVELQGYVNNYFDNLDVQEEINKKLDEMVQDGSLGVYLKEIIPYITPEMFGAKGNNSTDDYKAIQDCINFSMNNNNITILFSAKTYLISQSLVLKASFTRPNIIGNGRYNSIIKISTNNPVFKIYGGSGNITNNTIKDIGITSLVKNDNLILLEDCCGCVIDNCSLTNSIRGITLNNVSGFCEFNIVKNSDIRDIDIWMYAKHESGEHYSFHGNGISECTGTVVANGNILYIDSNCFFYNSPLSFTCWTAGNCSLVYLNANASYIIQTRTADFYGRISIENGNYDVKIFDGSDDMQTPNSITFVGGITSIGLEVKLGKGCLSNYKNTGTNGYVTKDILPYNLFYTDVVASKIIDVDTYLAVYDITCYVTVISALYTYNCIVNLKRFNNPEAFIINTTDTRLFNQAGIEKPTFEFDNNHNLIFKYNGNDRLARSFTLLISTQVEQGYITR